MRNRKKEIITIAEEAIPGQFLKSSMETVRYCESHAGELVSGVLSAVRAAVDQTRDGQEKNRKGSAKYLMFSHLYSSMFLRKYGIRVEILDGRFYNDAFPAVSYWDAEGIYRLFEKDVEEIKQKVERQIYRIFEYETDYIRYLYYPLYHGIAESFIRTVSETALSDGTFFPEKARGEEALKVSFGEYMGGAKVLFVLGGRGPEGEIL